MMKFQTFSAAVLLFALVLECKALPLVENSLSQMNAECSNQTGMDSDVLKNIMSSEKMSQPTPTYYKFLECLYKRQNYFDDKGYVSYSNIENFLSSYYEKAVLRRVIASCENVQVGSSLGERAYNAGNCIIKKLHEIEDDGDSANSSGESTNIV